MQFSLLRMGSLLILLMLTAFAAAPAQASFPDCNNSAYLARFDARLARESGFLCVESEHVPITSDAGTTHVRIIQHLVADWATRPGAMRSLKEGVSSSARAMSALGGFRISDVSILLVDGFGPGGGSERFGDIAAWTSFDGGDECRITVWLLGPGATASYGAAVVAHELFHCVQRSSLSDAQLRSSSGGGVAGGGTWWTEGSADWFVTLAIPTTPRFMADRVRSFDADSPTTPLNRMSYDAYVFFAWLGGARGPNSVVPFLRAMASSAAESAQRSAMSAALPADQWLRYAQDYRDQRIRDGHGASIGSTPQVGPTYDWEATRTQRIELLPFVIKRANLSFRCGRWRLDPQPRRFHAAKPASGDAWAPIPTTIDAMDGTTREFRFVGIATGTSNVALQVAATREASCQECQASREIDRCLIGTWQLTTDGMQQWVREHAPNFHITRASTEGNTLTLNEDRTFMTGSSHVSASGEMSTPGARAHGTARLAGQVSGRWSAAGGRFNMCPDAGAVAGSVTTTIHGRTITSPMPVNALQPYSQPYVCSGSSLRVTTPVGGGSTVTSVYTKVSGPR
ncbi:hypothetical protein [Arenimonas oryziterrae]|uniref:hypothetical protein n=1 Tax=Arenimonas oryziterrae TaxID=498055 RepID=UPI0012DFD783|nr:hypothetical protein [Arenimonas oryziterrae]